MSQKDPVSDKDFLVQKHINYLYFRLDELDTPLKIKENNLTEVYKNDEVIIYQYGQN